MKASRGTCNSVNEELSEIMDELIFLCADDFPFEGDTLHYLEMDTIQAECIAHWSCKNDLPSVPHNDA